MNNKDNTVTVTVPADFYSAFIFQSQIEERNQLLAQLQIDLQKRFKEDFNDKMVSIVKAPDEVKNNFIFVTEPDKLLSASATGLIEANLFMAKYNYKKLSHVGFHQQFKTGEPPAEQESLF